MDRILLAKKSREENKSKNEYACKGAYQPNGKAADKCRQERKRKMAGTHTVAFGARKQGQNDEGKSDRGARTREIEP